MINELIDKLFPTQKVVCECGSVMKGKKKFTIVNGTIKQEFVCKKCGNEAYVEERLIL